MKNYILFLFLITSLTSFSQSNCDKTNYYLVSAYSHVKSSYEANNISHLKYFANRSLESLNLSKKTLGSCDCEKAQELVDNALILLAKVDKVDTYEDGRFFVKQARELSKESVIEIEKFATTAYKYDNIAVENNSLNDLKNEQQELKRQQEALKLKEAEIKSKLAEQEKKEQLLKKEELILSYKNAIALNIKTYNETLKNCNCDQNIIKNLDNKEDTSKKSIEEIKLFYVNNLKILASNYLEDLDLCKQ